MPINRNTPNYHTGLGNRHTYAEAIVRGDLAAMKALRSDIPKSWFSQPWDNHGNKLLAFAAKIALHHGPVRTSSGLSPHAMVFQYLVTVCATHGLPLFSTAKDIKGYSVAHVIANHNKSSGRDAAQLLDILSHHAPASAVKRAFGQKYKGIHLPHNVAGLRGNAALKEVMRQHTRRATGKNSNNTGNVGMQSASHSRNQAAINAEIKRAVNEEKKKMTAEMASMRLSLISQVKQQAERVAKEEFERVAKQSFVNRTEPRRKRRSGGNPRRGFKTSTAASTF